MRYFLTTTPLKQAVTPTKNYTLQSHRFLPGTYHSQILRHAKHLAQALNLLCPLQPGEERWQKATIWGDKISPENRSFSLLFSHLTELLEYVKCNKILYWKHKASGLLAKSWGKNQQTNTSWEILGSNNILIKLSYMCQ